MSCPHCPHCRSVSAERAAARAAERRRIAQEAYIEPVTGEWIGNQRATADRYGVPLTWVKEMIRDGVIGSGERVRARAGHVAEYVCVCADEAVWAWMQEQGRIPSKALTALAWFLTCAMELSDEDAFETLAGIGVIDSAGWKAIYGARRADQRMAQQFERLVGVSTGKTSPVNKGP